MLWSMAQKVVSMEAKLLAVFSSEPRSPEH
jgi:hypothetical protein